jgi:hypothetical protein
MDIPDNPLLAKAQGHRPPSNSTSVVPFERPRKRVSAKTERLIGELGLRYRPSVQADLEEHAAQLALLAADVADIPPDLLERAIRDHAVRSPYLPKASELIALAQSYMPKPGRMDQQAICDRGNADLLTIPRYDIRWSIGEDGKAALGWI